MNTAQILIKTDPKLKKEAQKTAKRMGLTLTSVVNEALKDFVEKKKITFVATRDYPVFKASKATEKAAREALKHLDKAVPAEDFFKQLENES